MGNETYGIISLIPPVLAISLAIWTRQVLISLFLGILSAAMIVVGGNPLDALTMSIDWIVNTVTNEWNARFLVLIMFMGAGAAFIYKSGSITALERWIGDRVKNSRDSQLLTWLIGIFLFIDSYTSTIVTGNATKDISKRNNCSREAHSYVLDTTTSPVTTFGPISNWIGYQVSMIVIGFTAAGITAEAVGVTPYAVFLRSIPWNLYCLLAFFMVGFIALTGRYYGPMLDAEWRSRKEGKTSRDGAVPLARMEEDVGQPSDKNPQLINFILPILTIIVTGLLAMWWIGEGYRPEVDFSTALQETNIAQALLYAAFAFLVVAMISSLATKTMDLMLASQTIVNGFKTMMIAAAVIVLAKTIGGATREVGAAQFVVDVFLDIGVPGTFLPVIVFLTAMFIAFNTGTSWGTMAIITPIGVVLGYEMVGFEIVPVLMGVIFGGAIFGDHVSPISDTTVMSSIFSECDHIDHVKSQIPFALTAAGVTLITLFLYAAGVTQAIVIVPLGFVLTIIAIIALNKFDAKRKGLPEVMPSEEEIKAGRTEGTSEKFFNTIAIAACLVAALYFIGLYIFASLGS